MNVKMSPKYYTCSEADTLPLCLEHLKSLIFVMTDEQFKAFRVARKKCMQTRHVSKRSDIAASNQKASHQDGKTHHYVFSIGLK